jgi:hypothetical protein
MKRSKRHFFFLFMVLMGFFNHAPFSSPSLKAQSYTFGVKGGLVAGSQRWGDGTTYNNSLLFRYQGALFIESLPADGRSSLFAQIGYHIRGSAFRYRDAIGIDVQGNPVGIQGYTQTFQFRNLGLILGARRRGVMGNENAFFTVGIRGEYTLSTNLRNDPVSIYFSEPQKQFVRKLQYGMSVSGGYDFKLSEKVTSFLELSIHPDFSRQYFRQPFLAWDPFLRQNITVPEQTIRNLSIELTLGFRFLRKIEYID